MVRSKASFVWKINNRERKLEKTRKKKKNRLLYILLDTITKTVWNFYKGM